MEQAEQVWSPGLSLSSLRYKEICLGPGLDELDIFRESFLPVSSFQDGA